MAGTYVNTKVKIFYQRSGRGYPQQYESYNQTEWLSSKEKISTALDLIGDDIIEFIGRIIRQSPHDGFNPNEPIPEIKEFHWTIYSRYEKAIKHGSCKELKDGDMPVCFATSLPKKVDDALEIYHRKRKESYIKQEDL